LFKKFKSHQEAQAFIEGQPLAKKRKTDTQTKINFSKVDKIQEEANDSKDILFLNLPEYPDEQEGESSNRSKKKPSGEPKRKNPKGIKFEPPLPTEEHEYNGQKFQQDAKGFVHVYTDGSCEHNGKFSAAAGFGVFYGDNHPMNVSEPVVGKPTNNAGEIQAAIRAIQDANKCQFKRINIFTDSQFLINAVSGWIINWKKKGWLLASGKKVVNETDFKRLDEVIENGNTLIKWSYIPAHSGHPGNEEADQLAKIGANIFRSQKKNEK
jgi:ribonuclease HI